MIVLPAGTETVWVAGKSPTLQVAPGDVTSSTGELSDGQRTADGKDPVLVVRFEKMSMGDVLRLGKLVQGRMCYVQ